MKLVKRNLVKSLNHSDNLHYTPKRRGRVVEYTNRNGHIAKLRLHKKTPAKCSAPRRICIVCLANSIHKLEKNYELKVCKSCLSSNVE